MRSVLLAFGLASAAVFPAAAQNSDQFDLNCTGEAVAADVYAHDNPPYAPFDKGPVPYSTHLQVDLAAKLFCQDDCKIPERIAVIAPDGIIFRVFNPVQAVLSPVRSLVVRRGDGLFESKWVESGNRAAHILALQKIASGTCVKASYTPMPKNAF